MAARTDSGARDYAAGQVRAQIGQPWPHDEVGRVLATARDQRAAARPTWWAAQDGRVLPFWGPPAAPQLTLPEPVWRCRTQTWAWPRGWNNPAGLGQAALTLLAQPEARFHRPDRPNIRPGHHSCQSA